MSAHAVRLYSEGGLGITIELVHTGLCDQKDEDGECILRDWVENVGEDLIHGEIIVPVRVEWLNDDSPVLHLQPNEQRYREALEDPEFWARFKAQLPPGVRPSTIDCIVAAKAALTEETP